MPRYGFSCRACGAEFEVSRPMSEAGREATCPVDGAPADRVFSLPMTSVRAGDAASPGAAGAGPAAGPATRSWSSPFFPRTAPAGAAPARAPEAPRHVLPAGSSKPTRFRHFGHWHPAGTASHTHRARRAAPTSPPAVADA